MEAVASPPATFRLTPRPYQYEAVAALLAATARGIHRPLLVLPTGTGKTIVGSVSKVEITILMALICKVLFPSISTFETPPPRHHSSNLLRSDQLP